MLKPFVKLVLRNTGGNRRHARFILDWLAHKLQHPAVKMKTAVFVMSYENGVGKGLLIDKVAELFGEYYTPITTKDQKSDFNEYKACKLLSVCDEATYTGRLDLAEAIKNEITAPVIHVNEKYKPKYTVKNLSELWITSNRADGVLIRDKDRRYAAFRAVETRIPEQEALDYVAWFDRGGGKEAVMDYLLRRDLSGFNPHAPAPETAFKRSLIDVNRTSHQQLVADLAGLRRQAAPRTERGPQPRGRPCWQCRA